MRTRIRIFSVVVCFLISAVAMAANERVTLTGKVVDSSGKPLAHATALIYHAAVKTGYSTYCPSCYADYGKRAVPDAKGEFELSYNRPALKVMRYIPEADLQPWFFADNSRKP